MGVLQHKHTDWQRAGWVCYNISIQTGKGLDGCVMK